MKSYQNNNNNDDGEKNNNKKLLIPSIGNHIGKREFIRSPGKHKPIFLEESLVMRLSKFKIYTPCLSYLPSGKYNTRKLQEKM